MKQTHKDKVSEIRSSKSRAPRCPVHKAPWWSFPLLFPLELILELAYTVMLLLHPLYSSWKNTVYILINPTTLVRGLLCITTSFLLSIESFHLGSHRIFHDETLPIHPLTEFSLPRIQLKFIHGSAYSSRRLLKLIESSIIISAYSCCGEGGFSHYFALCKDTVSKENL